MTTAPRKKAPTQTELSKALADPLRSEILTLLSKRTASPTEIAKELDAELTRVSYHCRYLVKLNCAELVKEERARGWVRSIYRATTRNFVSDSTAKAMHPAVADSYAGQVWKEVVSGIKLAAESGSLDTQGPLELSCLEVHVDEAGYGNVLAILERAREEIIQEQAESGGRIASSRESAQPVSITLLGFRLPEKR